ncbi:29 kDa ribonucleoprotein A, chloroplastic [Heracleum sosnowskyi]|uniref:29 kDa ribonucleoprotein A, chloroplastic n=1 Tax=Heracleum sosnowskyi TaxID=360622 RepID=A0AAD8IV21_9APIA|nr:29 kDa ribonucleoprotein A, chloroplastic [Heracleum sosnowskyi]
MASAAAAAAASSLHFLSLTPKTHSPKPFCYSLSTISIIHNKPLSTSSSSSNFFPASPSSRVLKLAVSSDFGVEVDDASDAVVEEEPERVASFSPDLKIFVGNLPFSCDSATLAALFESSGNVEMVEVIYDKISGRSRGFGFVTMSSMEEVLAAVEQFNGYELDGRPLRVNAGPPPPREDNPFRAPRSGGRSFDNTNRVYVGNLSWGVDNLALETLFSEQGKVLEAKVVYDRESGRSRGFGFVTYGSANEVNRAIDSLNGAELDGREIRQEFGGSWGLICSCKL